MPRALTLALFIALVALVARFGYDRLNTLGIFRSNLQPTLLRSRALTADADGGIKFITNTINAEDLHLDPESGLIFTAVQEQDGNRAKWFPPLHRFADPTVLDTAKGGLRVIDTKTFTAKELKLEGFSGRFCTHGIDIIRDPDDPTSLYIQAVNHLPNPEYAETLNASMPEKGNSVVEIFHHVVGSDVATHVRTVSHPYIKTPNDIFALGPFTFFVTNDHHYREGHMRLIEDLGDKLTAGWTNIILIDADPNKGRFGKDTWAGLTAKVAHHGLHNNNGLGHTSQIGEVLINDAAGGVSYIAKQIEDHKLNVIEEVRFESTIDNPFWFEDPYPEVGHDASGIVNSGLIEAHKLAADLDGKPIPSVIWLASGRPGKPLQPGPWNTTVLFADDGTNLNSASASVLVAIDPKENDGKKQAWLFASGFASKSVVAVKVDL